MSHLKEIGLDYFNHFKLAFFNCIRLQVAVFILLIHALAPNIFTKTTSNLLDKIQKSFPKKDRILVRFNTKWKEDGNNTDTKAIHSSRQWRVLVNGVETLAHKVYIRTDVETIEEVVNGEQKFHFLCYGKANIKEVNEQININIV